MRSRARQPPTAAVADAIRVRRLELKLSVAELARETCLSETTIRSIGKSGSRPNRGALVAISAVLRWRYDYLTNVLRGQQHQNVVIRRPPTAVFVEGLLQAELRPVKGELAEVRKAVAALGAEIEELRMARGLRGLMLNLRISAKGY